MISFSWIALYWLCLCLYVEGFIGRPFICDRITKSFGTEISSSPSSSSSLTDFDDSVFDVAFGDDDRDEGFNGKSREEPKNAREHRNSYNSRATLPTSVAGGVFESELKRGDAVRVRIKRMDKLGAYVELMDHQSAGERVRGMILAFEVDVWAAANGMPQLDDVIDKAYIENVRPADGRVDVCLRPPGYERVLASKVREGFSFRL